MILKEKDRIAFNAISIFSFFYWVSKQEPTFWNYKEVNFLFTEASNGVESMSPKMNHLKTKQKKSVANVVVIPKMTGNQRKNEIAFFFSFPIKNDWSKWGLFPFLLPNKRFAEIDETNIHGLLALFWHLFFFLLFLQCFSVD